MVPDWLRLVGYSAIVLSLVLATTLGGTLVTAQGYDDAPDYTEEANHTVRLPHTSDHYPGDQNRENASQHFWFVGKDGLREEDAEEGIWLDSFIVDASWIDYSACDETNVDEFGIDRDNDNNGTNTDESLEMQFRSFQDGRFVAEFFDWDDLNGDPPYLAPEDAIVGSFGAGSTGGACLNMTGEPGWYQTQGFVNGTIAEENCTEQGNSECQPENGTTVAITAKSNYVYICQCENESEAREELGPPPGESTPTATPTPTDGSGTPTSTETAVTGDTPTPTLERNDTVEPSPETTEPTQTDPGGGGGFWPTEGTGAGFGIGIAFGGILGAALLARRVGN